LINERAAFVKPVLVFYYVKKLLVFYSVKQLLSKSRYLGYVVEPMLAPQGGARD